MAAFWKWFVEHENDLYLVDYEHETERERIFDQVAHELQKVDRDLTFEIGPLAEKREFVISAAGITRAFPWLFL